MPRAALCDQPGEGDGVEEGFEIGLLFMHEKDLP